MKDIKPQIHKTIIAKSANTVRKSESYAEQKDKLLLKRATIN